MAIPTFIGQLLFFGMCDVALTEYDLQKNILEELNTLLIYYIITYFIQRILAIIQNVKIRRTSHRINSLLICLLRLLLEWGKVIIVIVCLKEQGLKVNTTPLYIALTLNYYLSTEPTYRNLFPTFLKALRFKSFDGMEAFYAPVMLEAGTICMSVVLVAYVAWANIYFALICAYFVVTKIKSAWNGCWKALRQEKRLLYPFRHATRRELAEWSDICAVCLSDMSTGRITACDHIFHGDCLRKCIRSSNKCPLCKARLCRNPEFEPDPEPVLTVEDIQNLELDNNVDNDDDVPNGQGLVTPAALRNMLNAQMPVPAARNIYNRQSTLREIINEGPAEADIRNREEPRRLARRHITLPPTTRRANNRRITAPEIEAMPLYAAAEYAIRQQLYYSRHRLLLRNQQVDAPRRNYTDALREIAPRFVEELEQEH